MRDIQPAKVSDPLIFDSQGGGTDVESNYRVYLFDITTDSDWNKIGKLVIGQYVEKAITVVNTVYKIGQNIFVVVKLIISKISFFGKFSLSCKNLVHI